MNIPTLRNRRKHTEGEKEGEMKISQWSHNDLFLGQCTISVRNIPFIAYLSHNYNHFAG